MKIELEKKLREFVPTSHDFDYWTESLIYSDEFRKIGTTFEVVDVNSGYDSFSIILKSYFFLFSNSAQRCGVE